MKCDVINDVKIFPTVYRRIILLQIFDVIQSNVALQKQVHYIESCCTFFMIGFAVIVTIVHCSNLWFFFPLQKDRLAKQGLLDS